MPDTDLLYLSALELRRRYEAKDLSPVEVVDAVFEQVDRVNGALNALVTPTRELAQRQAKEAESVYVGRGRPESAPLLGIPITVKDNIATKAIRTTGGSLLTKDTVPAEDAPAPARAFAAGAVMLGKTNTPEYGWKAETTNLVFGTTRNPWNLDRTPGGSTGGGVACVATGIGPLAIGTDGVGSIRIPAAFTGLFGFKGTFGLVPSAPNGPLESLGHIGLASRHVRDAALLLTCLVGPHPRDRLSQNTPRLDWLAAVDGGVSGLRIAWSADLGYAPVEPEIVEMAQESAFAFREAGATVEEVAPGFSDPHDICYAFFAAANAGMHRDNWEEVRDSVDPGRVEMIELGFALTAADIGAALIERARWTDDMLALMNGYDLLLTPTMPITAFAAGVDNPEMVAGVPTPRFKWTPFTGGMNLTGQPAATVPCGLARDGLPVGLQIVGRRHEDSTVLRAAATFEAMRPWHALRPPIHDIKVSSA